VIGQSTGTFNQIVDGKYRDDRWMNGRWDLSKFAGKNGETDWDKVKFCKMQRFPSFETFRC
jgi:hypothetical protein